MGIDLINNAIPMGYQICKLGYPALRLHSEEVNPSEVNGEKLASFIATMQETFKTFNMVGLAAPQVGVNLRIFITELPSHLETRYYDYTPSPLQVWINPTYTVVKEQLLGGRETCMSIPGYVGRVLRPTQIMVQALNEKGAEVKEILSGWNARVFLHEYHHLDGIMYIDKVAENERGQKELFDETIWMELERERRNNSDMEWLKRFGLRLLN